MEKLSAHIERLLAYHEFVVVPQLGGFVIQKQSAEISQDKIIAPRFTIGFNPLMKHTDGLLATEFARAEGITFRKANELIQEEVEKVIAQLTGKKSVSFGNLGSLLKSDSGTFHFEPNLNTEFLPSNLGLYDLHISQKKVVDVERRKITFTLPTINTLRNVAAAILIIVLVGFSQQVNNFKRTDYADLTSIAFVTIPEVTVIADSCPKFETLNQNNATVTLDDSELYHVIVASMPTKSRAERYCSMLKSKNYSCAHVLSPIVTYRVAIQSFENKQQALEYMEQLRQSDEMFSAAWVLCKP